MAPMKEAGADGAPNMPKILRQLEYYFSDSNLPNDKFLRGKTEENPEGYVDISVLCSFNRMKTLKASEENVLECIKQSALLAADEDGKRLRRVTPLPKRSEMDFRPRAIHLSGWPHKSTEPTIDDLIDLFAPCGKVLRVIIKRSGGGKGLTNTRRFLGSVQVEMDSEEAAERVLAEEFKIKTTNSETGEEVEVDLKSESFMDFAKRRRLADKDKLKDNKRKRESDKQNNRNKNSPQKRHKDRNDKDHDRNDRDERKGGSRAHNPDDEDLEFKKMLDKDDDDGFGDVVVEEEEDDGNDNGRENGTSADAQPKPDGDGNDDGDNAGEPEAKKAKTAADASSHENGNGNAKDKENGEEEKLAIREWDGQYPVGIMISVKGLSETTTREDLRESCEEFGEVTFCDYSRGKPEGFMRFSDAAEAKRTVEEFAKRSINVGETTPSSVTLLTGEEEKNYWRETHERKERSRLKKESGKGRHGGRGRGGRGRHRGRGGRRGRY